MSRRLSRDLARPDVAQADAAEQAKARRAKARRHPIDYSTYVNPEYRRAPHLEIISRELEAFEAGIVRGVPQRLIIEAPPQHSKSQTCSIHFPEWLIGKHPDWPLILTSATADLAETFSTAIRDRIRDDSKYHALFPSVRLSPDTAAKAKWKLSGRSRPTLRALGIGGAIPGNPAKVLVIDDPIKLFEDAQSEAFREGQWHWWVTGGRTRIAQRGGMLMMLTRWHEADIAGKLIESMRKGGERVRVLRFPALAESQKRRDEVNKLFGLPPGLPDPLGREEGEALWPEQYDADYHRTTQQLDPDAFETLYQGNPVPFGSRMLPREKFKIIAYAPSDVTHWVRGWDLAFKTKKKNDFSSGMRVALGPDGGLYISRGIREKKEWPELREIIITTGQSEPDTDIAVESVAAQVMAWQDLARSPRLANRRIIEVGVDTDKRTRAMGWSWRQIYLVAENPDLHADWIVPFLDQAANFPYGANDDDIDGVSIGVAGIAMGTSQAVSIPARVVRRDQLGLGE